MTSVREEGSHDEARVLPAEDKALARDATLASCSSGDDVSIDKRVDLKQISNAARALKRHTELVNKKLSGQLFRKDVYVLLQIVLNKIPSKAFWYPRVVPLVHPIADSQVEICLFVKDAKSVKEQIKLQNVPNVKKVIGVSKLATHYDRYEARRKLASSYDLFLVQKKVAKLIPKLLGKSFLRVKRFPIVILTRESDLYKEVVMARDSTSFQLSSGPMQTIKIGLTSFTEDQICANFLKCINPIVQLIPGHWNNIKQMCLRTHHSPSLPFFTQLNLSFLSNPHLVDDANLSTGDNSLLEISLDSGVSRKRTIQYSPADAVGVSIIKKKASNTGIYVVKKELDPFSSIIEDYLREEHLADEDSFGDQKPTHQSPQTLSPSHNSTSLSYSSLTPEKSQTNFEQSALSNDHDNPKTPKNSKKSPGAVEPPKQISASDPPIAEKQVETPIKSQSATPRKQVETPTKSPSVTPKKQVETPVKSQPATPRKQTETPIKSQSATPEKQVETPTKPPSVTPKKQVETPIKSQSATPRKQTETPTKSPSVTPKKQVETPVKSQPATPRKQTETPINSQSATPKKQVETPTKSPSVTSKKQVETPIKSQPATPRKQTETPTKSPSVTPKKQIETPVKSPFVTSKKQNETPTKSPSVTPKKQVETPINSQSATPKKQVETPTKSPSVTPKKQNETPTKSPSVTSKKQAETPVKSPSATSKNQTKSPVKCSSIFKKHIKALNKALPKN